MASLPHLKVNEEDEESTLSWTDVCEPCEIIPTEEIENIKRNPTDHVLKISTVRSHFNLESFRLYRKYQVLTHNDPYNKVTPSSFTDFLIESPLLYGQEGKSGPQKLEKKTAKKSIEDVNSDNKNLYFPKTIIGPEHIERIDERRNDLPKKNKKVTKTDEKFNLICENYNYLVEFGSYHQYYHLNGRLIAVGVVDVLPECLSSVYCFYDPEFRFLALGKYVALKEIEWVQRRQELISSFHHFFGK